MTKAGKNLAGAHAPEASRLHSLSFPPSLPQATLGSWVSHGCCGSLVLLLGLFHIKDSPLGHSSDPLWNQTLRSAPSVQGRKMWGPDALSQQPREGMHTSGSLVQRQEPYAQP